MEDITCFILFPHSTRKNASKRSILRIRSINSLLRAVHVNWGSISTDDLPEMWVSPDDLKTYAVLDGDLLVCEGGDVGRAGIISDPPVPCVIQNALHRVRPFSKGNIKYLQYLLEFVKIVGWFDILCNKATIAHFTREKFTELNISIPPLPEQTAIAAFLDHETARIDALIEKKQRQIKLLQEKRAALISQAVTKGLDPTVKMKDSGVEWLGEIPEHWEVSQISRFFTLQRGFDITKDKQIEGDIPVISSGGISSYHNIPMAKGPGVLVGRKGTVGSVYYIESDYWAHDTTLWVTNFKGNCEKFLYYLLIVLDLKRFDTGSANPTINRNIIHPEIIAVPPYDEQLKISSYIDKKTIQSDQIMEIIRNSIEKIQEYRSVLISAAVTGKIDVRDSILPSIEVQS